MPTSYLDLMGERVFGCTGGDRDTNFRRERAVAKPQEPHSVARFGNPQGTPVWATLARESESLGISLIQSAPDRP